MEWLSVKTNSTFLFKQWKTSTAEGLTGAILCSVLLTLLHELLGSYIKIKEQACLSQSMKGTTHFKMAFQHCVLSVAYIFKVFLEYLLIFATLTYNTWIFISIGFSAGLGYLVIRPLVNYLSQRKTGQYTLSTGDIEKQPLFYNTPTTPKNLICPRVHSSREVYRQITDETLDNERQWEQLREMYRKASESRMFIERLKSQRSEDVSLHQASFSTGNVFTWRNDNRTVDYDDTVASEAEPNMWIQDASWDATLDMLEAGYVGRNESFNETFNTISYADKLVTMHVSVV